MANTKKIKLKVKCVDVSQRSGGVTVAKMVANNDEKDNNDIAEKLGSISMLIGAEKDTPGSGLFKVDGIYTVEIAAADK